MYKILFLLLAISLNAGERSSSWPSLRNRYISNHKRCECCGSLQDPQVHHIIPVNTDPSMELDYFNLITLCKKKCHLKVGHGGSYKHYNPKVRLDCKLPYDLAVIAARSHRIPNKKPSK